MLVWLLLFLLLRCMLYIDCAIYVFGLLGDLVLFIWEFCLRLFGLLWLLCGYGCLDGICGMFIDC